MPDIFFNTLHDVELDGGDLRFTTESEDVAQRLTIRLQTLLGEWFANTSLGLPYTQIIFEDGITNINYVYELFRTEIINTTGVVSIESLDININRDSRSATVTTVVNNGITVEVTV